MEDKQTIIDRLFFTLQATRGGRDIMEMRYERLVNGDEYVNVIYLNGMKRVDVTADSGMAMIRDVMEAIK